MAFKLRDIKGLTQPFDRLGMKVPAHNTACPNPDHGGSDSVSTSIVDGAVVWKCHNPACDTGGSIIDAYMLYYDIDEAESMRLLSNEFGDGEFEIQTPDEPDFGRFEKKAEITPTDQMVPEPTTIRVGKYDQSKISVFFKGDSHATKLSISEATFIDIAPFEMEGELCAAGVLRFDKPGNKSIYQCHYRAGVWRSGAISRLGVASQPLYKMGRFSDYETIIIVEGEKCMRRLQKELNQYHFDYKETVPNCLVTTTLGGGSNVKNAHLQSLEGVANIYIIPDNDEPGLKYAEYIKKTLPQSKIINPYPEDAWDGYDAVDWIDAGFDVRQIFRQKEVEVERDPLEYARVVAARLTESEVEGYFRELAKIDNDVSPIIMNEIIDTISTNTNLPKTILRETWKNVQKEEAVDWPNEIANYTIKRTLGGNVIFQNNSFWVYTGKYWRAYDDHAVSKLTLANTRTQMPAGKMDFEKCMKKATSIIKSHCFVHDDFLRMRQVPRPIINVNNGELHIQPDGSVELKDHDPKSGMTYCLDIDYDPDAECPEYDKSVLEIFQHDKDMVRHWHEIAGYIIQPIRSLKNFFIGYGKRGHNGKSSLFRIITTIVGQDNVAAVRFKNFGQSRFDTSVLVGKILMLDDDLDKGVKLNDGIMKQLSEQKLITAEFKGRDHFQFMQYAAPVMLSNHLPTTTDMTKAMITRASLIPFNAYFDPQDASTDKQLFNRIIANELPGVLNRFLNGLKRLRERGSWDEPQKCRVLKNAWMEETNNTYLFYKTQLKENPEGYVYANDLWDAYRNWAKSQGISDRYMIQKKTMMRALEELDLEIDTHVSARHGRWKLVGYELRAES